MPQLQIQATISDIEPKKDKNFNPFYKLSLQGFPDYFYAFATDYTLKDTTLRILQESPEKLVNQLVLITYEESPNKDNTGNFKKVKEIQVL